MPSRVLVADDDPSTRDLIDMALQEAGYDCVLAADGKTALELTRAIRPDLVVLDVSMPFLSGDEVHRELRRDPRTRYIPVLFVTAKRTTAEMTARFRNGADDYVAKPFDVDELVARIASALRRAAELRSLNPLSGLPGNLSIAHEIDVRLADATEVACLYVDVDHFKDFNDHHGFARGDRLIAHLAELLSQTVGERGDDTFIGHVGGDDFVVLVPGTSAEELAKEIIARFDASIPALYDAEDRARGWVESPDRRGRTRRVPFVTVSIGIVPLRPERFAGATEVARAAAEMKEVAKRRVGSGYAIDRRRGSVIVASPTP
ncbi:MAG TPA: response regulator [Candidatus Limnocylindria bacterium]|jgi:diguanylate cyclase (GGDEF)-like protein|nr:response regulator [Candidatus Limnocylindria bacterium]